MKGGGRRAEWAWLLLILLAAVALRLWRLDSVPPGLTHDEANNVHDAAAVLDGGGNQLSYTPTVPAAALTTNTISNSHTTWLLAQLSHRALIFAIGI